MGIVFEFLIEALGDMLACLLFQVSWRRILLFYGILGLVLLIVLLI